MVSKEFKMLFRKVKKNLLTILLGTVILSSGLILVTRNNDCEAFADDSYSAWHFDVKARTWFSGKAKFNNGYILYGNNDTKLQSVSAGTSISYNSYETVMTLNTIVFPTKIQFNIDNSKSSASGTFDCDIDGCYMDGKSIVDKKINQDIMKKTNNISASWSFAVHTWQCAFPGRPSSRRRRRRL